MNEETTLAPDGQKSADNAASGLREALTEALSAHSPEPPEASQPTPSDTEKEISADLAADVHNGNSIATCAPAQEAPDIDSLLAEAEQRGYLKGRNERIEQLMKEPTMYQQLAPAAPQPPKPSETFLSNLRPSIWDA